MKRLLFTAILLLLSTGLFAESMLTMKAVLVICDDYISAENNSIADGVKRDRDIVEKFLDRIKERKIVKLEKTVLNGKKASSQNVKRILSTLKTGNNDILLVYFSGHGGMEQNKTFLFFTDDESISREELEGMIKKKNARLSFLISDACSSSIDTVMAPKAVKKGFKKGEKADAYDPVFRELFYSYRGLLHVTAAKEGQYATGTDNGGLFTIALINESLMYPRTSDWGKILKEASESTNQKYKKISQYQKGSADGTDNQDSQNPQVYSFPKYTGKNQEIVINDKDTTPGDDSRITPDSGEKRNITIYNDANFPVSFYIDRNKNEKEWSEANLKKVTIKAGKEQTFEEKGVMVVYYNFLQNGKRGDSLKNDKEIDAVELDKGGFAFAYEKDSKTLEIFTVDEEIDDQESDDYNDEQGDDSDDDTGDSEEDDE